MKTKSGVYKCLITVIIISVLIACTPTNTQSSPTIALTSTSTQVPPTATETQTSTPVPTETITPTPTPESLIKGNIFQDPQSREEFKDLVLAPSPIDEPEEFALWQDEYLKQIYEKAEDYRDKAINENFGIMGEVGFFIFHSSVWNPIASYKFMWQGQEMLSKTFLFKSLWDDLVPITLTYTPEDSWFFSRNKLYETPDSSERMKLYVMYAYRESMKEAKMDDFLDQFLPTDTSKELNEVIARIWWNGGEAPTEDDYEEFSKMNFILANFQLGQ
ncbi:MAG: hypothetical protein ACOYKD_00440 [Anaerolineaceae bacterium]|jgi:hypothetical protein